MKETVTEGPDKRETTINNNAVGLRHEASADSSHLSKGLDNLRKMDKAGRGAVLQRFKARSTAKGFPQAEREQYEKLFTYTMDDENLLSKGDRSKLASTLDKVMSANDKDDHRNASFRATLMESNITALLDTIEKNAAKHEVSRNPAGQRREHGKDRINESTLRGRYPAKRGDFVSNGCKKDSLETSS